jgi:hypothetical protein
MLKITGIVAAAAMAGVLGAWVVVARPGPPSAELLSDLAAVRTDISGAEAEAAKLNGMLCAMANLRVRILRSSEAMLEQRRLSVLHGIQIVYREDAPGAFIPPDEALLIQNEMDAANADLSAAEAEVARYNGGLIQTMAMVRVRTAKTTLSMLHQQQALIRYHIPIPNLANVQGGVEPHSTPGNPASDRDALR